MKALSLEPDMVSSQEMFLGKLYEVNKLPIKYNHLNASVSECVYVCVCASSEICHINFQRC